MRQLLIRFVILGSLQAWAAGSYLEAPWDLPVREGKGRVIEAEHYDRGEEGVAYHDLTPQNEGGQLRNDGVDIYKYQNDFFYVGSTETGEWLTYSLNNSLEGNFDIELRLSSASATGTLALEIGDHKNTVSVPYSGGWDSWRLTTVLNLRLPKGPLLLRLSTTSGNYSFDYVKFIRRP